MAAPLERNPDNRPGRLRGFIADFLPKSRSRNGSGSHQFGRFELLQEIGRGATSTTYRAYDPRRKKTVALKVFQLSPSQTERFLARIKQEARILSRLNHPSIAQVYEQGKISNVPFIALEFVEGCNLEEILEKRGVLSLRESTEILLQLCSALSYTHEQGVIHRDIKPSNILIGNDGRVKLVDFGISKTSCSDLTSTQSFLGTPSYMAPEQIMNRPVDQRADIFSLGVLLYQLLSGQLPFEAQNAHAILYRIVSVNRSRFPDARRPYFEDLEKMLDKALAKRPEDRYSSCVEFVNDLDQLCRAQGEHADFLPAIPRPVKPGVRRYAFLLVLFGLALIVGLVAVYFRSLQGPLDVSKKGRKELSAQAFGSELPMTKMPEGELSPEPIELFAQAFGSELPMSTMAESQVSAGPHGEQQSRLVFRSPSPVSSEPVDHATHPAENNVAVTNPRPSVSLSPRNNGDDAASKPGEIPDVRKPLDNKLLDLQRSLRRLVPKELSVRVVHRHKKSWTRAFGGDGGCSGTLKITSTRIAFEPDSASVHEFDDVYEKLEEFDVIDNQLVLVAKNSQGKEWKFDEFEDGLKKEMLDKLGEIASTLKEYHRRKVRIETP